MYPGMQILVDNFKISEIDREGKLYRNVSRGYMHAGDTRIVLDYHSVLCKLEVDAVVEIRILSGVESEIECDYLALGKVYQVEDVGNRRRSLKASFGGLLLILDASEEKIGNIGDRSDISLALTIV